MMTRIFYYIVISVLVFLFCSCISNNDKCIQKLLKDSGIEIEKIREATHLIIIPGSGCNRRINEAKSEIHASTDTIYIVVCRSEKDFYLLTNKHLKELPNTYIDSKETAVALQMVGTVPMVYIL